MVQEKIKILAISGSTKKNSSNESILKFIAESFEYFLDVKMYDGLEKLPHFNPDLDNEDPPAPVKDFRDLVLSADGVIICTPEYVFSLPGSLKNAFEWCVSTSVFLNKPVAIIVASASGEQAFTSLDLVMTTIGSRLADHSKLLIKGIKGKVGTRGEIIDKDTCDQIKGLVESFIHSIEEVT
jgi:NAD(P)H-dependent FMN reductase